MSLADGRTLSRGLVLDIEALRGNVLATPRAGRVSLSDQDGEFLVIHDVTLDWSGLALLSGRIDIGELDAARLEIARQPVLRPSTSSGGTLPALRINRLNVSELVLDEAVLGSAAVFSINGEARIAESGRLALEAVRTDIEGDHLSAEFRWSEPGEVTGAADLFIAADSPLAALLRLEGLDTRLTGEIAGNITQGAGTAELMIAGSDTADLEFGWSNQRWTARAYIDGAELPDRLTLPFDATSQISMSGPVSPPGFDRADIDGRDWQISVVPEETGTYEAIISLSADFISAFAPDAVSIGQLHWNGTIDTRAGLTADGVLELGPTRIQDTGFEALGGALIVTRRDGALAVFGDLTATELSLPGSLPVSELPWAALAFEARQSSGEIQIPSLTLESSLLSARGDLAVDLASRTVSGRLTAELPDAAQISEMADGPVRAELDISSLSGSDTRFRISLDASGINWQDPSVHQLLAGSQLSAQISTDYTHWDLQGLRWQSGGLLLTGGASGEGLSWSAQLDAAINGDIPMPSATLQGGAAIALEAEGEGRIFTGTSVISTPLLALSGQEFLTPRLGLDFDIRPDSQQFGWQAESGTQFGQLVATGEAYRTPAGTRVDIASGQIGGRSFTGLVQTSTGELTAQITGTDWDVREGIVESLTLDIAQDNGAWRFAAEADGMLRHPFTLSASAMLDTGRISGELDGRWADIVVRTREPLTYDFGDETPGLLARLRIGTGRANIRWTAEDQFRIRLDELPADLFASAFAFPELSGQVEADIAFRDRQGQWSGEISATAADLRLRQLAQAAPVTINATGRLDESLSLDLDLAGDDLTGSAHLVRSGRISSLDQLREDAPLSGTIAMSGAIEPLLTLVMPDTRHLAGQLSADLAVSGSVFQPRLRGPTRFENGRYLSEELGVNVDSINGGAIFEDGRLTLNSFSAQDPDGGTLTATGDAWRDESGWRAEARLEFTNFNAVRRPDLNIVVTGSSDVTLASDGILITGEAELDRVEARPPEASAASFAEIDVTEINRPDGQNGQRRNRIPVALDYQISAPGNIFISGEPFSSEWRGSWHVRGSPSDLDITGTANLIIGRAFLLNRAFRLEEGRVSLAGSPRSAEIDLLAIHSRDTLTVNARLTGPATAPTLTLSSEPALPQDEILARLLFDQNASQLSPLQTATIAAQLSGQNLFGVVGSLRRAAGLDRLDFDTTSDGQLIATAGQQLTEDVYLELESRGTALSSARLEWTLTPDFTLLSRLTGDTDASIALRWRTEFD